MFILMVVAYLVANRAVHGWRELGILIAITAVLIVPIKLIASGTWLAESAFSSISDGQHTKVSLHATGAVMVAVILGSLVMLAVKRIVARRQSRQS